MNDQDFQLFKKLVEAPSPSGFEQPVQRIYRQQLQDSCDLETDVMGNVIARLKGAKDGALRVMLAAHADEIGFMVKAFDESGAIYFDTIGGVDPHLTPGKRITVHTKNGPVLGVFGKKPIHLMDAIERESLVKFKDQFIDIGCTTLEDAKALVSIGDPITFCEPVERLNGNMVTANGFDDKVGVFIVTKVLEEMSHQAESDVELYGVSTVQEELGLRGAATATYGINPALGIAIDVGFATDIPGVAKKDFGDFKLGSGPIIPKGANINPVLSGLIEKTAEEEGIPIQVKSEPRATGTDANRIQLTKAGVATALVKIPLRNMHSSAEIVSLEDVENAVKLIVAVLKRVNCETDFVPC
jgi:endoglucanase